MKAFTVSGGVLIAAMSILIAASFAPAKNMDEAARTLVKLDGKWAKAAAARDVDRVAAFYADDATAYPPSDVAAHGKTAARKVWADYFAEPTFTISWTATHAEVSGDLGYTAGTYQDSFKGADGQMVRETGKYVCVWAKQQDGTWKAIHDMWNGDAK